MCSVSKGFINDENQAKCEAQTLTLQDINEEFINATPDVPYSFIQVYISVIDNIIIKANLLLSCYSLKRISCKCRFTCPSHIQ